MVKKYNEVWQDIIDEVEKDNIIKTLSAGKTNVVERITPDGLLVTTAKNESQLVKIEWIKDTWNTLVLRKYIVADDIPGKARYRSSFIMALFARLSYIKSTKNPNTLYLNDK